MTDSRSPSAPHDQLTGDICLLLGGLDQYFQATRPGADAIRRVREWLKSAQPSDTEAPERTLAKYISTRDAALEEAAEECLRLWKTASNNRASGYWQNALSHGCVASAKAIRALKTAAPQAEEGTRPRAGSVDASDRSQLQPAVAAPVCVVATSDAIIERVAKHIEDAPLTYAGPDPNGVRDLRFLIVAAIRGLKGA